MKNTDRIISLVGLILIVPLIAFGVAKYHDEGEPGVTRLLGGLATLALYSILYKENPIYRFAEHVFLGLAAGYLVVISWTQILSTQWYDPVFKPETTLVRADILKPVDFFAKLKTKPDPVSASLAQGLTLDTRTKLEAWKGPDAPPVGLQNTVVEEINGAIQAGPLYEPANFQGVQLTPEIMRQVKREPTGADMEKLNRQLLVAAYPGQVDGMHAGGRWLWLWLVPLGLMGYFVFSRKHGWVSRIPLVLLSGFVAGQQFQAYAKQYLPQIRDSFKPLIPNSHALYTDVPTPGLLTISGAINNLIFVFTLVAVVVYFLFAFEQKNKVVQRVAVSGRWLIMIGFGAIFGSTIMTRFALLVDRMYFVLIEWLKLGH